MAIELHFLGWDRPLLAASVDWLAEHYCFSSDLGRVGLVVTARRAGRRLLELLAERAASQSPAVAMVPPLIVTLGELPERLYAAPVPPADELTSLLARCQALRSFSSGELKPLIPQPPQANDLAAWLNLSSDLASLDDELSAQGLSVAQVPERLSSAMDFTDADRWNLLAQVQQRYESLLAQQGLMDRHRQREQAIDSGELHADRHWILIGAIDLNRQIRRMVSKLDGPVTSLVFAPPDQAEKFDEFGAVVPGAWQQAIIPLADDQWSLASRPSDQADTLLSRLVDAQSRRPSLTPDQITIGLCDATMGPMLARRLELASAPVRLASGERLSASEPATFLRALAAFVASGRWDDFSSLIRHGPVEAWVHRQIGPQLAQRGITDWHTLLDRYLNDHLQGCLSSNWLGRESEARPLAEVYQAVWKLVPSEHDRVRPLGQWASVLADLLKQLYGQQHWHRLSQDDAPTVQAIQAMGQQLQAMSMLADDSPWTPRVTFVQSVAVALEPLSSLSASPVGGGDPQGAAGGEIELLGWMELAMDDAPVLIVTGVNEGSLPSSVNSDAFLPNEARRVLGLPDNAWRYARDAAWLTMILHSREQVHLIGGRWDGSGDPLRPSRLVLAVEPSRLADRVLLAIGHQPSASRRDEAAVTTGQQAARVSRQQGGDGAVGGGMAGVRGIGGEGGGGWRVPYPEPSAPLDRLRVTAFRDYLACPYRFYLKHVLKLQPMPDPAMELDPAGFGTLAHQTLEILGQGGGEGGLDRCDRAEEIERALEDRLAKLMRERYGDPLPAALAIQQQQLQERLAQVARWQAEQAAMGWRIESVEREIQCVLDVGGQPFTIVGKIDRIDRHEVHGHRLIDYKTKDSPKTPQEIHGVRLNDSGVRRGKWRDLQLPLYVKLVRSVGISDWPVLGYLQMPRDLNGTGLAEADWRPSDIEDAWQVAERVISDIRANRFWPPTYPPPDFSEQWSGICQDQAIQRWLSDAPAVQR